MRQGFSESIKRVLPREPTALRGRIGRPHGGVERSIFAVLSDQGANRLFGGVGSGIGHTIDPTSNIEKLTNSIASDHCSIGLS